MIRSGGSPEDMPDNKKTLSLLLVLLAMILIGAIGLIRSNSKPEPTTRSRVPVAMINGQDLINMQQQVKDQQAQIDQLKSRPVAPTPEAPTYSCSEPNVKCGPNEKTSPGVVTDFGAYDLLTEAQSSDVYIGFNFTDREGFSKHFYPVCPGQTIKTGASMILYHWRNWDSNAAGKRGCFMIDGFQQQ